MSRNIVVDDVNKKGYTILAMTGDVATPASEATVVLWTSENNNGRAWKAIVANIYSSHVSATDGLMFEESNDGGTTWETLVTYTIAATAYSKREVQVSAPMVRVRYVNSANTLSAFRFSVLGDAVGRGAA